MKKIFCIAQATILMAIAVGCSSASQQTETTEKKTVEATPNDLPTVYYGKTISPESLIRIYEALGRPATGRVAVKISTGEAGNNNYLKPELIGELVKKVNGTLVECNTAYAGKRTTFEEHRQVIREHGFEAIGTVDLMDEEGEMQIPVRDTTWIKYNIVGKHLSNYDFMINLAHFKGHPMGGFGGVLKNQSIGVASANGKANIHSAGYQQVVEDLWNHVENQDGFLESMAAAAQSVADKFNGNIVYIDIMNNMSVDCDCVDKPEPVKLKDMGIMASLDPVAVDQACIDMVFGMTNPTADNDNAPLMERISTRHGIHTIEHAEKIGMGSRKYNLKEIE